MHLIFVLLISMVRAESTAPATTPPPASAMSGNGPITINSNEPAKTVSGDATKPQPLHYVTEFNNEFYKADDCATKNKYDICVKILKMVKKFKDVKYADAVAVYKKACELKVESCEGLFEFAVSYAPETVDGLQKFFEDQCTKNILNCNELSQFYEYKKDYTNAINYARKYYVKFQKGNLIKYTYKYGDKTEALTAAFNECKAKKYNSCILVIGASDTESSKQYDAFVEFCKNTDTVPEALSKVQLPACIKPLAKDVPKQLKAYAELELKKLEN